MRIVLDKNLPSYRERLDEMLRIAAEQSGVPKGVFCFKTFEEFSEWKDMYKRSSQSKLPKNNPTQELQPNK